MMDRHEEKDRELEHLFEAARETDREAAPAFRQILAQGRVQREAERPTHSRARRFAWMTAAASVAVVAIAAWLGTQPPSVPMFVPAPPQIAPVPPPPPPPPSPIVSSAAGDAPLSGGYGGVGRLEASAPKLGEDEEKRLRSLGYSGKDLATQPSQEPVYEAEHDAASQAEASAGGPAGVGDDAPTILGGVEGGLPHVDSLVAKRPMAIAQEPFREKAPAGDPPATLAAGDVEPPQLLKQVTPQYPDVARSARIEGRVVLQAVIDEAGSVSDVEVLRSQNELLDDEAIKAVRQWKYKPATQNGQPVPVYFTIAVDFDSTALNTETYAPLEENPFLDATANPLSTFSIDVDTASYANVRRFLNQGQRPPRDAVRIEEMVNYFRYDYPLPKGRDPFGASIEVAECPWNPEHRLARIGLKGREIDRGRREPSNLVFLIDVSGSMNEPNKLPLLQQSLGLLVDELDDRDRVAIVVYAGASGLVLPSTPGSSPGAIRSALGRLQAGGGTNGGEGLRLAYETARQNFVQGGTNRVILATDGDFNLGVTSQAELLSLIEQDAKRGIFLTALGFGMGNYKDSTLEMLADKGNGNYAYIDSEREARKVLVEELTGTLVTIAKDVKIQVEFNPAQVGAYRLIGYENRMLRKEDFNDDRKDAGEIGAGHTVTALYEIVPASAERDVEVPSVDPLRYQRTPAPAEGSRSGELLTLKLRYKEPEGDTSRLLEFPAVDSGARRGSPDFEFAAAVAGFGMLLRGSEQVGDFTYRDVAELAQRGVGRGEDREYRRELVELVTRAAALDRGR